MAIPLAGMEEISPVVTGLLGGFVAFLLLAWAARGSSPSKSKQVLRFSGRMRAIAILCLAIALFIGFAALHASPSQRLLAYAIGGVAVLWATWFALDVFLFESTISEEGLEVKSLWGSRRSIPWHAFVGYHYSGLNNCHVLLTKSQGKVRLSEYLGGVERVLEKLDAEIRCARAAHRPGR